MSTFPLSDSLVHGEESCSDTSPQKSHRLDHSSCKWVCDRLEILQPLEIKLYHKEALSSYSMVVCITSKHIAHEIIVDTRRIFYL